MSEATSKLPRVNRKIIEVRRKKLLKMAEHYCPNWNDGVCRETGKKCNFSTCSLVDRIAGGKDR